ncbi:MAG TPA: GYF domain-containing protein [Tepidisphaeraceae bacterium]|nr:GYF domain-containing protein [Tepidisphaeraceae bacterium]
MNYYFADGSVQKGPFPMDQLVAQGLKRESLVWREGMAQWQRAESVPELAGLLGSAAYQPREVAPPPPPNPGFVQPPAGGGGFGQPPPMQYPSAPRFDAATANSQKIASGICGILIGGLGIHKFILGMTGPGLIMLLITVLTCGFGGIVMHIIGIIEGIIYLTKTDEEFYRTYMVEKKAWF